MSKDIEVKFKIDPSELPKPTGEPDKDGWYVLPLIADGVSSRTGVCYPPEVLAAAFENLAKRTVGPVQGEITNPATYILGTPAKDLNKRMTTIVTDNVSHVIDPTSITVTDGVWTAKIKPTGPHAKMLEKQLELGECNFALRGFVQYENGNHLLLGEKKVSHLDIVTFDLTDKPL